MPSYLSLACAVNGYSTTTKYNSERISKSRESSPHRLHEFEHLTPPTRPAQSSCNNFLSPPNSSHSHAIKTNSHEKPMEDQLCSIETLKVVRKEGHSFTQSLLSSCSAGNLQDNGGFNRQSDIKTTLISRVSESQEFFNSRESKSFIQQRVERLYGPGALAQGFFVNKRQRSKHSESNSDKRCNTTTDLKLFSDNGQYNKVSEESVVRQSCSSSTLPVLRHLRPEFRAQLSIVSLRRSVEGNVVTKVTDQVKITNNLQPPSEIHENVDWTVVPPRDTSNETKEKELPEVKDGHYFLEMCIKVNNRLLSLAAQAEAEAEQNDLSEEVKGKLRSAYGKARLLVSQKMEQFKGLCVNNIHQSNDEQFPTTNEDLQGFWDMVTLQVDEVNALFDEVEKLRKNNWQVKEEEEEAKAVGNSNGTLKKSKKSMSPRPSTASNDALRKQRDAARKQMMEVRRKAMKAQKLPPSQNIEIFLPECSSIKSKDVQKM